MSEDFDPSPRDSKRRRTATYSANRSHVGSASKTAQPGVDASLAGQTSRRISSRIKAAADSREDVDSAYGSKEDSLVEDELQDGNAASLHPPTAKRTATLQSAESIEIPETPENAAGAATGTSRRKTPKSSGSGAGLERQSSTSRLASGTKRKTPAASSANAKKKPEPPEPRGSRQRNASRGVVDLAGPEIEESEDELQVEAGTTPVRGGSTRTRRKPRRYSVESQSTREPSPAQYKSRTAMESAAASPQPKGILTPSKGRRNGQRKSVLFDPDDKQIEEQLGFKDIDKSVKKARRSARATKAVTNLAEDDAADADEDEVVPPAPAHHDPLLDFDQPADILASLEPVNTLPMGEMPEDSPAVTSIKAKVLARLTSANPSPPAPHLASQQSTLTNLLTSTVVSGESNSLLLLGPRGAGKTLLLEHVLSQLMAQYSALFHVVRLNGFLQTDDRLALREIWRQLGRETQATEGEENTGAPVSYADTLASLLSLLSHPDEMDVDTDLAEGPDINPDAPTKAAKSVILVLDEFDLFTLHPRQTLLYNLFDIAQSRKAPIAVVGCSTRMDVVESLEKRVKSRFSHRWLHIPPVRTLTEMKDVVETALLAGQHTDEDDSVGGQEAEYTAVATRWDEHIKTTFLPSDAVSHLISQTFYTTKSIPDVLSALYPQIATLGLPPTLSISKPSAASLLPQRPNHLALAPHLPTLHLTLLAALASPSNPAPLPTLSTTYSHYTHLLTRTRLAHSSARARTAGAAASLRPWPRALCAAAWEDLLRWGLLVPQTHTQTHGAGGDAAGGGGGDVEWLGVRLQLEPEEVLWALKMRGSGSGGGTEGPSAGGAGDGASEAGVLASWVRGQIV